MCACKSMDFPLVFVISIPSINILLSIELLRALLRHMIGLCEKRTNQCQLWTSKLPIRRFGGIEGIAHSFNCVHDRRPSSLDSRLHRRFKLTPKPPKWAINDFRKHKQTNFKIFWSWKIIFLSWAASQALHHSSTSRFWNYSKCGWSTICDGCV